MMPCLLAQRLDITAAHRLSRLSDTPQAKALGDGVTTGERGAVPAGDIVIVALLYASVVPVVAKAPRPAPAW